MRKVTAVGVGMTKFGKLRDQGIEELGAKAVWEAIKDAGINPGDIQIAYCGVSLAPRDVLGQAILKDVGITQIPTMRVENACSSGSSAVREAWMAIVSGLYDIALAIGVEKLTDLGPSPLAYKNRSVEAMAGYVPLGWWAMRAQKHMEKYGTTREQLAQISVKNHANGCLNPRAQYQERLTIEGVLSSPTVADPLTLYQASPISDGAAAVVLCSEKAARKYTRRPVYIAASALTSGNFEQQNDLTVNDLERRCGQQAYQSAGIGPEDLDFAEIHDCFTIAEIIRCENLGFCKHGEYTKWQSEGKWDLGGGFPINPSGGLLAKGHPVGATGVAQICELVWHLREQAGERQVAGARVALAHCSGGTIASDNAVCAVHILKR